MNLGSTCLGSTLERRCLKQHKKESERGCFNFTRKVPDSSVFCCASPPKKDGQVFEAAVVASHQDFGFQAALQRLGMIRNLSGQLPFSARRCRDVPLDDAAVQGLERMLRVKARLDVVSAGYDGSGERMRLQMRTRESFNCMRFLCLFSPWLRLLARQRLQVRARASLDCMR